MWEFDHLYTVSRKFLNVLWLITWKINCVFDNFIDSPLLPLFWFIEYILHFINIHFCYDERMICAWTFKCVWKRQSFCSSLSNGELKTWNTWSLVLYVTMYDFSSLWRWTLKNLKLYYRKFSSWNSIGIAKSLCCCNLSNICLVCIFLSTSSDFNTNLVSLNSLCKCISFFRVVLWMVPLLRNIQPPWFWELK